MPTAGPRARRWCSTRSAASAARCASSDARMTPLRWTGSSSRRSAATGGSTRRATATPSWASLASVTRPTQEGYAQVSFLERVDEAIRRSAAWRSLFRQPYPTDERSRAMAVMNNVFLHLHPVRVRQHAVKFAYTFCLGGLSFFLFLVLTVTGVYLMFFYVPSATQAYTQHPAHPGGGAVRAADPQHPSLGRAPDGVLRLPAHDAGLLPRRLQAAARVQLGGRRGAAVPDHHAVVHRLPAAVGPDRLLGHHHRHQHGQLRAAASTSPRSCSCWAASRSARTRCCGSTCCT